MPSPVKNGSSPSAEPSPDKDRAAVVGGSGGARAKVRTGRSPLGLKQQDSRPEETEGDGGSGGAGGSEEEAARLVAGKENAAAAASSSTSSKSAQPSSSLSMTGDASKSKVSGEMIHLLENKAVSGISTRRCNSTSSEQLKKIELPHFQARQ